MTTVPNSYDSVAYPPMIFDHSHPDRMAVLARLHGLGAADAASARVLHIGGGDDLDLNALAAAYPTGQFFNFDVAPKPIARARALASAAGLTNARHEVLDILEAADQLDGPFDYIVANGIYSWVPTQVRAAVMPLIGRLLAPNGVAFVSFNAFPGGHTRLALREMLLHGTRHLTEPQERLKAARALLRDFVPAQERDEPIIAAMRKEAAAALAQQEGIFFHDVFNQFYQPFSLLSVAADARAHGLRYLGDARGNGHEKGFVDPQYARLDDKALLDSLQAGDYRTGRYFHASLFVRTEAVIGRTVDRAAAGSMWISSRATATAPNSFVSGQRTMKVENAERAALLARVIAAAPAPLAVAELTDDPAMLSALCNFALAEMADLAATGPAFTIALSERPKASPLARAQVAAGATMVATLSHQAVTLGDPRLRNLLMRLDGTHDRMALMQLWAKMKGSPPMTLDRALKTLAGAALIQA